MASDLDARRISAPTLPSGSVRAILRILYFLYFLYVLYFLDFLPSHHFPGR
jgi:hypothetical protein